MFKRFKELLGEKEKEIPLLELGAWIARETYTAKSEVLEDAMPLAETILKGFRDVRSEVEEIENVEKELFRRLSNITKTSQKKFCDSIRHILERVSFERKDYEGIVHFLKISLEALSDIRKMDEIHGKVLYFSFPDEMKEFRASVKSVAFAVAKLENVINSQKERVATLRKIEETFSEREGNKTRISQIEHELSFLQGREGEEEKRIEGLSTHKRILRDSAEFKDFESQQFRLKEMEEEIKDIEGEINGRLSPLLRVFRKALSEKRHGKAIIDETVLVSYIESPLQAFFLEQEGYPKLTRLLSDIFSIWDTIEEKDKKKLQVTMTFIHEGGLQEYQKKRLSLLKQRESGQKEKPKILSRIEEAEEAFEEGMRRRENTISTIASLNSEKRELEKRNDFLLQSVRENTEKLGTKITG